MALLVNQTQVPALTVPVNATTADANEVRGNDDTLRAKHNLHDADGTIHVQSSTLAARAAAGVVGRHWYTSDTAQFWYDNGTVWVAAAYAPTASPTFTGTVTLPAGIVWATIPYTAPVADAAGVLTSDGAGTLSFEAPTTPTTVYRSRLCSGDTITASASKAMIFNTAGRDVGADVATLIPHSTTVTNTRFGEVGTRNALFLVNVSIEVTSPTVGTVYYAWVKRSDAVNLHLSRPFSGVADTGSGLARFGASFLVPQEGADYWEIWLNNGEANSRLYVAEVEITRLI